MTPRHERTAPKSIQGPAIRISNPTTPKAPSGSSDDRAKLNSLSNDIASAIAMRPDFALIGEQDVIRASRILARNGIISMIELRPTPKRNRDCLVEDLRKNGYEYLQIKFLLLRLFDVSPPIHRNAAGPNQRVDIEEVCIPRVLGNYRPSLAGLSARWRPGQSMANYFSAETYRASCIAPAYVPYPVPDLTKRPWAPNDPEQDRALNSRQSKMRGLRIGHPLNMQSIVYFRARCILAGDLANAFDSFGGLVAQFNLLGAVLRLAIVESPYIAIEYDRFGTSTGIAYGSGALS